ncbi:branched-chain amino acid transport system II carrier protein [Megasphaera vaginalis (ex Bordigoni et al. 2020)]|uniref:branched-chain amino acid transport system II carrier protein n=1 Tax=Megasphaera vaginalis (ex Bordigoni et al. 2020) TaxID=2045301 RepID=UPI000C7B8639|nr:branched-chain amino acid transport system II carrier protein [Megasphaera vaginalis (ex Bordigoni et al. 2020)]
MGETTKSKNFFIPLGLMLFALFFGAGNLIFPASMGQHAGTNVWYAVLGFVFTGVGLPLAGVLAMGYSGCRNLEELAGRVHPVFGVCFTVISYMAIGPCFATPRTGSVSYEIAVRPFLENGGNDMIMTGFLVIFFVISYWLSATPSKLVDRIGKILTPALLITILILIAKSFITPLGVPQSPTDAYATAGTAWVTGFLEGYNTMDAIASLVFSVLVIEFIVADGVTSTMGITKEVFKSGVVAVGCLAFVYIFISKLGAESVTQMGILETGAPVLSNSAQILLGYGGAIILAIIVLLACLSTSIGLITSCATYFQLLLGHFGYKTYVAIFSVFSFGVAMFGLKTIIVAAIPVLMFVYPIVVVLIILTFLHKSFGGRQCVYAWTVGLTMMPALINGTQTAKISLGGIDTFFNTMVPLHSLGMGWVLFALAGFIIGLVWKGVASSKESPAA